MAREGLVEHEHHAVSQVQQHVTVHGPQARVVRLDTDDDIATRGYVDCVLANGS